MKQTITTSIHKDRLYRWMNWKQGRTPEGLHSVLRRYERYVLSWWARHKKAHLVRRTEKGMCCHYQDDEHIEFGWFLDTEYEFDVPEAA